MIMPPKLTLGIAPLQQITQTATVACVQKVACECSLCKQTVSAKHQLQLTLIIIELYSMCPSCRQRVRKEIELASWYRRRWDRRMKAISKSKGWDWQSHKQLRRTYKAESLGEKRAITEESL
jgi:hypothetical protein